MNVVVPRLGEELFPGSQRTFEVAESHVWFNKAVARWLDIALYKAMQRIIKAVDLDDLSPVDDLVQHSSSAVDIRTVLMQIKTFWAQLCWPDVESSYAYISKILDVSFCFLSEQSEHLLVFTFVPAVSKDHTTLTSVCLVLSIGDTLD